MTKLIIGIRSNLRAFDPNPAVPAAHAELRASHRLDAAIFEPRDDILAGTANARETRDRFGSSTLFGAFHAEPTRCDDHLASGRPLPERSRRYVADLAAGHRHENAGIRVDRHREGLTSDTAEALCCSARPTR